jgi:hypothetical protein
MKAVEEAISKKEKDEIESSLQALQAASSTFMQKVYQQNPGEASGEPSAESGTNQSSDTIDAEFDEKDDSDKK